MATQDDKDKKKKKDKGIPSLSDAIRSAAADAEKGLKPLAKYNPAADAAVDTASSITKAGKDYDAGVSGKDIATTLGINLAQSAILGRFKSLKPAARPLMSLVRSAVNSSKQRPKAPPAPVKPGRPQRGPAEQPNPALPLPGPSRGPSRRVRPRRSPEAPPKEAPAPTPKAPPLPKPERPTPLKPVPAPAPAPQPAPPKPPLRPDVKPVPAPAPAPKTTPKTAPGPIPAPTPTQQPKQAPGTKPDAKPGTDVKQQTKPQPQPTPGQKTKPGGKGTGVVPVPTGRFRLPIFGARGRDLRTHVTGTGVREEYIQEQESFKKFKVMYILHGEEKTNVYRYKGKDTFAKARVLRQLRERGAGSIRFMQYESVEMDEAYMPDATRKPVVYRAPPKRGEVVGKMKVRLIRRHQDVMPGERTATSENTKRLRRLIRKVLRKGKLKKPN